jgi:glycosyltransferase involved in cell wall biosynthesis
MKNKILLFIPCYNCENQISEVLQKAIECKYISQILVVNNCSTDNTEQTALNFAQENSEANIKVIRNKQNYGLGGSHKVAFKYAIDNGFDYVITLHGDNQGNLKDIEKIINEKLFEKYDCCLGSRFMKESKCPGYSKIRILGNICFNIFYSLLFCRKILDIGSGLNIYKVKFLTKIYQDLLKLNDTLSFNPDMISLLCYFNANILFFPIVWSENGQISNAKIMRLSYEFAKIPLLYLINKKRYISHDHRKTIISEYTYILLV